MASTPQTVPQSNSVKLKGKAAAPNVIRETILLTGEASNVNWLAMLPAFIFSGGLHVVFVILFLFVVGYQGHDATAGQDDARRKIETEIEKDVTTSTDPEPLDITNKDAGIDPEVAKNNLSQTKAELTINATKEDPTRKPDTGGPTVLPPDLFPRPSAFEAGKEGTSFASPTTPMNAINYIPGGFGGRESAATRQQMATMYGGNEASEAAVARALDWLATHQARDGSWSLDRFNENLPLRDGKKIDCDCEGGGIHNNIAGTAFGLLPFLGAGVTPTAKGKEQHNYSKNVEMGLRYLMDMQKSDGAIVVSARDRNGQSFMYAHGLATITLCEASSLAPEQRLQNAAQRAVNFIVTAQHTGGGWRYRPGESGDTSVVGWQVMALQSARMAGLVVPNAALEKAGKFLDAVQYSDGGGYGYISKPGSEEEILGPDASPTNPTMTAVGLLCRQYLGWGRRQEGLLKGVGRIGKRPPDPAKEMDMYYYYYATQVMHHMGGDSWKAWNTKMRDLLISRQDGGNTPGHAHQKGSWSPANDRWGRAGGRLMMTSLCTLTLEVYYRHLPLYQQNLSGGK